MRTVELMEEAVRTAESLGYSVRHEWLGGAGGGACEFAGKRWIFVDLALTHAEQLAQIMSALGSDPAVHLQQLSPEMRTALDLPSDGRAEVRPASSRPPADAA